MPLRAVHDGYGENYPQTIKIGTESILRAVADSKYDFYRQPTIFIICCDRSTHTLHKRSSN